MLLWHVLASLLQRGRLLIGSPAPPLLGGGGVCHLPPHLQPCSPALLRGCPPRQGLASALLGGGIVGYVLYDTTHWALHSGRADWMFTHTLKVGAG